MGRFMITAMPFTGHVVPLLAVASALRARGHDVRFYTGSAFRERVEASGATLVPWRAAPDFDENDLPATFPRLVGKKGLGQLLINVADLFMGTAPQQVEDLEAEWTRDPWDVLAADEVSIGSVLAAERLGFAWATVAVLPLNMPGTQGPPSGLGLAPGRNPLTKTRDAALRAAVPLLSRPLRKPLADARAAAGLPPSRLTMDRIVFSPRLVVASGSTSLDYRRRDRPPSVEFVGRLLPPTDGPAELPGWWDDLRGRRIVHVTQGTQNVDPADLIAPALDALADRDDLVVVVATGVRGRDILPFPVPSNARVAGFLPYGELLPLVEIVVTNGGWGGTLAALSHGIPLAVAGGDLDKPEIAARVAWAGAGVDLRTGTPSASAVRAAVGRIETDASFRAAAERVGQELRSLGGAPRAAALLEGLLA
ncbi:nucleotide disphospho-sugar-binding domain-containing protein [Microbacterium sp. BK668]|uniref:glycosyltransferase n=1 Tax=Microbacterium sp. BK668 TaxID=2512118 RepID=UPI00105CF179|nr:nucleotide disphospho-sugar-binding domain-containing protein [Microbacterium sp. BK668]TDN90874.1 MGT family glycosyltransferase [Microbacterium sp. BK668]